MHILALNAYHGGSHRSFINDWQSHSQHQWTLNTLPANHWKWRMSHAAISFAEQLAQENENNFELIFCTDMLNLAEFIGLAPAYIKTLPKVIYFHENQLTYPDNNSTQRDLRYAFTNFISALAADEVWFNSAWHLNEFHIALQHWLLRMPDQQPKQAINNIFNKAKVQSPGIADDCFNTTINSGHNKPLTILWAARWEQDKNPQCFFDALKILKDKGIAFRLNIIGSSSRIVPDSFDRAKQEFSQQIDHWGFAETREQYLDILRTSDLVISTALHEFFGIAILEAVACGCIPLLPNRLAYPETLSLVKARHAECFYEDSATELAEKIITLNSKILDAEWRQHCLASAQQSARRYHWQKRADEMDENLNTLVHRFSA
ncbi:MAG: DUF3524 domain-containing protein [Gammaproteobacteria bacterium]|nr:DUF3524 domain-containing protein [Gammaproteobacteria bacterium]